MLCSLSKFDSIKFYTDCMKTLFIIRKSFEFVQIMSNQPKTFNIQMLGRTHTKNIRGFVKQALFMRKESQKILESNKDDYKVHFT